MEPWGEMPTVLEAAEFVRDGRRSAAGLLDLCISRIEERNPLLNAFVHLDLEPAREAAEAVDLAVARGDAELLGPLAGVPFGVKDLEDCAGMPTTRGSRWFAGGPAAAADDIHVARLRAAGAIPVGKTASPEFGAWAYTASPALGVTRNPWDPSRTPGGSSGGSSAAVGSGMVPFCTASDGGGSIRTPAAFTGLVGLKPSYGRIPTLGVTWLAQNAVVGSLTTTVSDTALLLDLMAGPDPRDRTCLPAPNGSYLDVLDTLDLTGVRVAFSVDLGFSVVEPEVAVLVERAARVLVAACGATLVDRPVQLQDYIRTYAHIEGVDMFVGIPEDLWRNHLDLLDPRVAPGWASAQGATLPKLARVEEERRALVRQMAELFEEVDLLVTPMTCMTAFAAEGPMPTEVAGQAGHGGMAVIHGMLANLANLPAVSVPAGVASDGLPVGMQVIGPRHREDLVLAAAHRYEEVHPWSRHAPRVVGGQDQ
jgi:aspartyl-tRNA(Asn)/glutamyl-tRNA(Gln) amidotransferase subunit A